MPNYRSTKGSSSLTSLRDLWWAMGSWGHPMGSSVTPASVWLLPLPYPASFAYSLLGTIPKNIPLHTSPTYTHHKCPSLFPDGLLRAYKRDFICILLHLPTLSPETTIFTALNCISLSFYVLNPVILLIPWFIYFYITWLIRVEENLHPLKFPHPSNEVISQDSANS